MTKKLQNQRLEALTNTLTGTIVIDLDFIHIFINFSLRTKDYVTAHIDGHATSSSLQKSYGQDRLMSKWAQPMGQLVEQSLSTLEACGSNLVTGNLYLYCRL